MHFPSPVAACTTTAKRWAQHEPPAPSPYPATFFMMLCIVRQLEAIEKPKGKQAESCVRGEGGTLWHAALPRFSANHKDIISSIS